ncbi:MAG: hypothetical protein JWM76_2966 [Pseudonocardiales bacterium]|nr:hypothetical protein [Pseudonocardiales bacterium]
MTVHCRDVPVPTFERTALSPVKQRILETIAETPSGLTRREITSELRLPASTAAAAVRSLVALGLLTEHLDPRRRRISGRPEKLACLRRVGDRG